jgi:hypothetical protein
MFLTFQSAFYKPFSGSDVYIVEDLLNYTEVTKKSHMDGGDLVSKKRKDIFRKWI